MKEKSLNEIYSFIMEYEIDNIENEDKIKEKVFGDLTDMEEKYLSEIKFRYFKLGYNIAKTLEDFRNGGNNLIK